jgi:hypothetical protein
VTGAWRRLGPLALDTSLAPWAATHAALPVVEPLEPGAWRVYLSLRDPEGRARIGATRLTIEPRPELAPLDPDPVLDLGPLGAFDESGVTTSSLVADGDRRLLYYTGWSLGVTVPFYLACGVAVSERGGAFRRLSPAPLLDRSAEDPFLTASPFVLRDGGAWRMWYVSATAWQQTPGGPRHYYNIREAASRDGLVWRRGGRPVIDYASPAEHAFARPWVVRDPDAWRMWYAVRGDRYRIGYAESRDGSSWVRLDAQGGLEPAGGGWEAEMVEYPAVFDWRGARFMLYNGNGYGRTGVGLARREPSPAGPHP